MKKDLSYCEGSSICKGKLEYSILSSSPLKGTDKLREQVISCVDIGELQFEYRSDIFRRSRHPGGGRGVKWKGAGRSDFIASIAQDSAK